jgi:hypothetical protein
MGRAGFCEAQMPDREIERCRSRDMAIYRFSVLFFLVVIVVAVAMM